MTNKDLLRKKYRSNSHLNENISGNIISNLENFLSKNTPSILGVYIPLKGEVDISSLMLKFPNIIFAAPRIDDDQILFVKYHLSSPTEKSKSYQNFLQPSSETEVFPDMIIIPSIAFDIRGYRLGRGKGHYDKYLANHNPIKIGIAENKKIIEYIPAEEHDIRMDFLINEEFVIDLCR